MTSRLKKRLAPLFFAAATFFTSISCAQVSTPEKSIPPTDPNTPSITFKMELPKKDGAKAIYEMDYPELIKEKFGDHKKAWELYEFFQLRRIYLSGAVDQANIDEVISKINILNTIDPDKTIELQIDSPGGSVYDGLRLYNKMKEVSNPIRTVCNNMAASMAAVILLAGDERVVTPTGRILIHEVAAGTRGQTRDMEIQLWHIQALEDRLYKIISENTGLSMKDVRTLCKADVFYGAEDSLRLGFIDIIAPGKPEKRAEPGTRAVPPELLPENLPSEYAKKRAEERAPKAKPAESTPAPAPTLQ